MADDPNLTHITQAQLDILIEKHESFIVARKGGARANLSYHDLRGMNLAERNLSDADFTGASLVDADLHDVKLDRAVLYCTDLRGANLHGASLLRADLRGATLRGANLVGANMEGVDLREGSLATTGGDGALVAAHKNLTVEDRGGANLAGANLSDAKLASSVAINSNFSDATLKSVKLSGSNLKGANFSGANLENADFSKCDVSDVDFRGAVMIGTLINLSDVKDEQLAGAMTASPAGPSKNDLALPIEELVQLHQIWLTTNGAKGQALDISRFDLRKGIDFSKMCLTLMRGVGAILYGVNFSGAQLQSADLREADMRQTKCIDSDMRGICLAQAKLNNAIFRRAQLQPLTLSGSRQMKSNLARTVLRLADFTGADLRMVDFRNADLSEATFLQADISGADFTGAKLDRARFDDAQKQILAEKGIL